MSQRLCKTEFKCPPVRESKYGLGDLNSFFGYDAGEEHAPARGAQNFKRYRRTRKRAVAS